MKLPIQPRDYHLIFTKLSLQEDSCQTIIDSSSMYVSDNKKLAGKINELKKFILDLWLQNYIKSFTTEIPAY